ncbi:MAG: hypothetical protein NXI14_06395, partial [bacterium]|nr:hypothetical protein [bacterium]
MTSPAFFAYPSNPPQLATSIREATRTAAKTCPEAAPRTWEQSDVAGHFVVETIYSDISKSPDFYADITVPNFNVIYEIGY